MRLWHETLLPALPRQQLLGQHRECCALRGNGWGKRHRTVNYAFRHSPYKLYQYHMKVMNEMKQRGYRIDSLWADPLYRGKTCPPFKQEQLTQTNSQEGEMIYPEHDQAYLQACIDNLADKGIHL